MSPDALTPAARRTAAKRALAHAGNESHPRRLRRSAGPSAPRRVSGPASRAAVPASPPVAPPPRVAPPPPVAPGRARAGRIAPDPAPRKSRPSGGTAGRAAETARATPRTVTAPTRPATARPTSPRPATARRAASARPAVPRRPASARPATPRRPARPTIGGRERAQRTLALGRSVVAARPSAHDLAERLRVAVHAVHEQPLLDRLIRARGWIPLLGIMLAGIVFMQVEVLKLNAGVGRSVQQGSQLSSENALLRASVASLADDQRIESVAAGMGMVMPAPTAVGFLSTSGAAVRDALTGIHVPNPAQFLNATSSNGGVAGLMPATAATATNGTTGTATVAPTATTTTTAPAATTTPTTTATPSTAATSAATTTAAPTAATATVAPTAATTTAAPAASTTAPTSSTAASAPIAVAPSSVTGG